MKLATALRKIEGAAKVVAWVEARRERRARATRKRPKRDERPRCGARCRDGHACNAPVVWKGGAQAPRNGRCRMHGGLSTGPRSREGWARTLAALNAWRIARGYKPLRSLEREPIPHPQPKRPEVKP